MLCISQLLPQQCYLTNSPQSPWFLTTVIYSHGHGSAGQLIQDGQICFRSLLGLFIPWTNNYLDFLIITSMAEAQE